MYITYILHVNVKYVLSEYSRVNYVKVVDDTCMHGQK